MRHLITYACMNEGNFFSKHYTQKLREHWNKFDGKKVCALTSINEPGRGYEIVKNLPWDEIHEVKNTGQEADPFLDYLLPSIQGLDGYAFYAHSKGVTHEKTTKLRTWVNELWDHNMNQEFFGDHDFYGVKHKPTHSAVDAVRGSHYHGTFYWMNPRVVDRPYREFYDHIKDLPASGADRFPWRKTKTQGYYFTEVFPDVVGETLGVFE